MMYRSNNRKRRQGQYCVLLPAFQAEKTIAKLVRQVRRQGLIVVVIDDGSSDRTASLASEAGALVISHLKNCGKGSALRTGFSYAVKAEKYDGVITMDSDGQHDPSDIPELIRVGEIQHAGIVVGNRFENPACMPKLRRMTNILMSRIISELTRQNIPDSQCGLRFIRKEVLIQTSLTAKRYELESELLLQAARKRWKTVSVPIHTIYQEQLSYIRPIRDTFRFLRIVFRYLF